MNAWLEARPASRLQQQAEPATSKAPVHLQQPPLLQAAAQLLLDAAAAAATSPAIHKQVGRWAYYWLPLLVQLPISSWAGEPSPGGGREAEMPVAGRLLIGCGGVVPVLRVGA